MSSDWYSSSTSTNTDYGRYYRASRGYYYTPTPLATEVALEKARKKKKEKEVRMPTKPIFFDPKDLRL